MKKTAFTFLLLSLFIISCKKDGLTKETSIGANTFSCKINGKIFLPCIDFLRNNPVHGNYNVNITKVEVRAECIINDPIKYIFISLNNFHSVGEYLLSDSNNICTYEEIYSNNTYPGALSGRIYNSTLTQLGRVIITKDDRANFILSGTFEFTAANTVNPIDIVTVSSGRFDIKIN